MTTPIRILHAPSDTGGHARGLSRAERELGLISDVAVFSPGPFGYRCDFDLHAGTDQSVPVRMWRRAVFLAKAIRNYDVFHFNLGQTLLQVRQLGNVMDELAWLRRCGKTIVMTYQGCDARPLSHCFCQNAICVRDDPYRPRAIRRILRYADRVFFLNPDLAEWLPTGQFLPYASVNPREIVPLPEGASEQEVVIAHAPTNRLVKGTQHVVDAVDELRLEGASIRLDLIERVSREEALRRTAQADIVVDQLMLGWYGGYAVEAMALGKPVLCSIDETKNPFGEKLPIVRASRDKLTEPLRELVRDAPRRRQVGQAGRKFVESTHDPRVVARHALTGLIPLPTSNLSA